MNQYNKPESSKKKSASASATMTDRIFFSAFIISLALLAFIGGAFLTAAGVPPGPQITRAYEGGKAVYSKLFDYKDVFYSDLWHPATSEGRGVTVYDKQRSSQGVTLYTSGHEASAYLISMDGQALHKWHRPFSQVWNESAAVQHPQPDSHVFMRKAQVDRDGNLLAIYEGVGDSPYGYGLVKLDKDSNVIWSYLQPTHHDFDIAPDGRIFVLTQEIMDEPLAHLSHLATPRIEDFLVILSPSGQELEKIRLLDAVFQSDFKQMLNAVSSYSTGDPLHTNSVHFVTEKDTQQFHFAKPGQVMLSFRELGAVAILDLEQQKLVWAIKGYWAGQHDPHILANGNILLFDNLGHFNQPGGQSRAIEFDPNDLRIVWQYTGTSASPLDSVIRSYTQRLANGNTLITESNGGRILEVTADQQVVWEYVNPVRGGANDQKIPVICKAQRLPDSAADFLKSNSLVDLGE